MDDTIFTRGPARRPLSRIIDPTLQWSTGLPTLDRRLYAGWLCPIGQHEGLDNAMEQLGFSQIAIKHGGGNVVTHWAIETANLFVLADGVQTRSEMKQTTDRFGIAFGWRKLPDRRWQSQIRLRAFLYDLLAVGFSEPLLVTAKGTLTGDLLTALLRQYDVLDQIEQLRRESGKAPLNPPFYACSIPLGTGACAVRGSLQTREIIPMTDQIPTPITKEYILAHWPRRYWIPFMEAQIDATVSWSISESVAIADGSDLLEYAE